MLFENTLSMIILLILLVIHRILICRIILKWWLSQNVRLPRLERNKYYFQVEKDSSTLKYVYWKMLAMLIDMIDNEAQFS